MNKHFGAHSNKSIRNATNEEVAEAVVENIFGGQASANAVEGTIPVDFETKRCTISCICLVRPISITWFDFRECVSFKDIVRDARFQGNSMLQNEIVDGNFTKVSVL